MPLPIKDGMDTEGELTAIGFKVNWSSEFIYLSNNKFKLTDSKMMTLIQDNSAMSETKIEKICVRAESQ